MEEACKLSLTCDELDQFNELAKGWDVDFRALARSDTQSVNLFQSFTGQSLLTFSRFDFPINQHALSQTGMRSIAILPPDHPDVYWCGKHISGGQALILNKSGEMNAISQKGFEGFLLSVSDSWFEQQFDTNKSFFDLPEEQVIKCDKNDITALYKQLTTLKNKLNQNTNTHFDDTYQSLQNATLSSVVSTLFESSDSYHFPPAKERRVKALNDALHYIHAKRERISIPEICSYAKVSERTLERLFGSMLGVSPKKYLNRFLLQEANTIFKNTSSVEVSIIGVVHTLGFSHMGQFAADYKRMFGERPSETLQKG